MYAELQWTDADVVKLCGAIATGKLVKLETLYLGDNQIGDAGVAALAEVVGKLPKLKTTLPQPATRLATPVSPRSRRWRASCPRLRPAVDRSTCNPNISQQVSKSALKGSLLWPVCNLLIY